MLVHPQFDPIAIQIGPLAVRWYGLMYLTGFVIAILLGRYRIRTRPEYGTTPRDLDDMVFYALFGVILGGRLGYVLFYKLSDYLQVRSRSSRSGRRNVLPRRLSRRSGRDGAFLPQDEEVVARRHGSRRAALPLGLGAGRLADSINAELWGRPTDVPWATVFPNVDLLPRHPSQLYEFALEGIVLFAVLWWFSSKPRPTGAVSGLFLIGYGLFRFCVEFTREPDDFLGLLA